MSSIGRWSCGKNYEKTPLSHKVVWLQIVNFETSNSNYEVSKSSSWKNRPISFSKTTVFTEGAVSLNVLYYQPLHIFTRYQVRFYANNYLVILIVSTAFNSTVRESIQLPHDLRVEMLILDCDVIVLIMFCILGFRPNCVFNTSGFLFIKFVY